MTAWSQQAVSVTSIEIQLCSCMKNMKKRRQENANIVLTKFWMKILFPLLSKILFVWWRSGSRFSLGLPHVNIHCYDGVSHTLQRQNTEISKQIFPKKENIGVSVQISTFMRLWVIYIFPRSVCLFCWSKYVDRSWDYKNRSQTHEYGNWGWGRTINQKRNT